MRPTGIAFISPDPPPVHRSMSAHSPGKLCFSQSTSPRHQASMPISSRFSLQGSSVALKASIALPVTLLDHDRQVRRDPLRRVHVVCGSLFSDFDVSGRWHEAVLGSHVVVAVRVHKNLLEEQGSDNQNDDFDCEGFLKQVLANRVQSTAPLMVFSGTARALQMLPKPN